MVPCSICNRTFSNNNSLRTNFSRFHGSAKKLNEIMKDTPVPLDTDSDYGSNNKDQTKSEIESDNSANYDKESDVTEDTNENTVDTEKCDATSEDITDESNNNELTDSTVDHETSRIVTLDL